MVSVKNLISFGKISQQNVFDDNYSRKKKEAFLDFKIRKLKK